MTHILHSLARKALSSWRWCAISASEIMVRQCTAGVRSSKCWSMTRRT